MKIYLIRTYGDFFLALRRRYLRMFPRIRHLTVIVSNCCNLKCYFCSLWKIKEKKDLSLAKVKYFFQELKYPPQSLSITGGEPFMREDISEFYFYFRKKYPQARIYITTNATLTQKIDRFLSLVGQDRNLAITLSFNGSERELIGKFSRSKHALALENTLFLLKNKYPRTERFLKQIISGPETFLFSDLYAYAKEFGCKIQFKFLEYAPSATQKSKSGLYRKDFVDPGFFRRLQENEKKLLQQSLENFLSLPLSSKVINGFHIVYLQNVLSYLRNGRKQKVPCPAAGSYLELSYEGKMYPCRYLSSGLKSTFLSKKNVSSAVNAFLKGHPKCPHPQESCLGFWNFYI